MKKNPFIILNGGESVGKGTQSKKLLELFPEAAKVREPGGTPEAEKIRFVILDADASNIQRIEVLKETIASGKLNNLSIEYLKKSIQEIEENGLNGVAETFLYAASRSESNEKIVIPSREKNNIILGDRSVACSMAYQGYARGLGMDFVWEINKPAIENAHPDLEIFLNLPLEIAQERLSQRTEKQDRLDNESIVFHEKVRKGYIEYYEHYCNYPFEVIDATGSIDEVHEKIKNVLKKYEYA